MGNNLDDPTLLDRLAIRELIENWALWRDAGDWERFRTVWHDDGKMYATWFQGSADDLSPPAAMVSTTASASCIFWADRRLRLPEFARFRKRK